MSLRLTPDPKRIEALQAEAARNPAAYERKLAVIAIAGDVVLTALQVLPWGLPIWIGMSFYNFPYQGWAGAIVLVFLVWLVRPSIRFNGRELKREEAPRLFSEIDTICSKLQAPGRMQVMLDDSFNASAAESRGVLGLAGTRCALTLGVPLLAALSREQVLAVVAHEFGHFSRRHNRLGQWLYRAHYGWLVYANEVTESDSALDKAMAAFAELFVPYFSTLSFVHSRQCEYEADSDAASVVGNQNMAIALSRIGPMGRLWIEGFSRELDKLQQTTPEPPSDIYERFSSAARNWPQMDLRKFLDEEIQMKSSWNNTHPCLSDRVAALKEKPQLGEPAPSAGGELLGDAWPRIRLEFNAKWLKEVGSNWIVGHLYHKHIEQPLLAIDGNTVSALPIDQRFARARVLRRIRPDEGLAELRSLHHEYPDHSGIAFSYAAALLREKNPEGAAMVEKLAKADPTYRVPVYQRLTAYYEQRGDAEQAEISSIRSSLSMKRQDTAVNQFMKDAESGSGKVSSLSAQMKAVIAEAVKSDTAIAGYHLIEGVTPLATNESANAASLKIHALFIVIDPDKVDWNARAESDIVGRYQEALDRMLPANEQGIVHSYSLLEYIPAFLAPHLRLSNTAR